MEHDTATGSMSKSGEWARPRLSRVFSQRVATLRRPPSIPARVIWGLCAWVGLACGLVESLLRMAWGLIEHRVSSPDLWINWNAPWLTPLSLAVWLLGFGLVASLARVVLPRATLFLSPYILMGLGTWSVVGSLPGLDRWAVKLLVAGVAFRLGRHVRFESEAFRRRARASLPFLVGVWLLLFTHAGVLPATSETRALRSLPAPARGAPNVLLVVLDTVRADNLSLHGYDRPTAPRLETWARRGARFDQARATTPYTLGTHASLFTGHWMSETSARVNTPLDGRRRALAEHLRDRGYATAGFVGNIFYGSAHYGLNRGFLHYHDIPGNITRRVTPRELLRASSLGAWTLTWIERKTHVMFPMQRMRLDAEEIRREALAWVDSTQSSGRPFFLFLNYFDAHSPYSLPGHAPQPFSRITADRLETRMKRLEEAEARLDAQPSPAAAAEVATMQSDVNMHLRNAYDDGIAWIDRELDAFLDALDARGLLDDTLVIVTSDHGEMLGEHEVIGHGKSLHRQVVHVPLVVVGKDVPAATVVKRPVSLRDVPATVLDLIGDTDAGAFPGRSLRRFWSSAQGAEESTPDDLVLSEMEHLSWRSHTHRLPAASGPLTLLTEGRWSYHRQEHETLGTREQLFDLDADPLESRDLSADPAHQPTLLALRRRLEQRARGN